MLTLAQDSRGASVPRQGQWGGWSTLHLGLQEAEQAAHIMTDQRQRKEGTGRGLSKTASKDMLPVTYILQVGSISYFPSPTDKTMIYCESSGDYSTYQVRVLMIYSGNIITLRVASLILQAFLSPVKLTVKIITITEKTGFRNIYRLEHGEKRLRARK